ncbi:YaaA family protein [Amnibacterium endophyticum]|uniref:YaaA family protein n=1 Tax=Amnibacterium endophyticum TaxID=2109337 RepID=A0ABW4LDP7_9MICO
MLILLPPSETKSEGGDGALDPASLSFPSLRGRRRAAAAALRRVPLQDAPALLKLGRTNAHEAAWNRVLTSGPTRPAIERYTGVLYDGLDAASLDDGGRAWIERHVVIASALFGLLGAGDRIPRYRLSGSTALPGLSLKAHWRDAVADALAGTGEWVLDARSAAYAALGAAPVGSALLHVETAEGRALNHFNKHAKGALTRRLAETRAEVGSRDDLLAWAASAGVPLEPRGPADVVLRVEQAPLRR